LLQWGWLQNARVSARHALSRFVTWLAVFILLMRSAVPALATSVAHWRGVSVAEVCAAYGVALPTVPATGHPEHGHLHARGNDGEAKPGSHGFPDHDAAVHGGDHCALAASAALPAHGEVAAIPGAAPGSVPSGSHDAGTCWFDPFKAWAARLEHAPPVPA
jgi:hypothetical protein